MKALKLLIILVIPLVFIINVEASTTTYPRDGDNLGISSDIKVTDENRAFILNTPKVDAKEKIYDFADLFTDYEEEILYDEAIDYISSSSYDLAIVTIDNNPKSYWNGQNPTAVYADDFHDYNDFKADGIIILIDMQRREYYISTSGKAILMYDDTRIERLLDEGESEIKNGDYYLGIANMVDTLKLYFDQGIPSSNRNCEINEKGEYYCYKTIPYLLIAIISGVVTAITVFGITRNYKKIKIANDADNYMIKSKAKINEREDVFLYSNTVKVRKESSSSGGSSFGGSSTHSSSSGHSHGGGGRGF